MLYHQTKDPYYVQHFPGHKSIRNTEIYINIEHTMFEPTSDEFTVKIASKTDDVKASASAKRTDWSSSENASNRNA
jgi:hypothetical protein